MVCIELNAHEDKDRLPLNDTKLKANTLYIHIPIKMYKINITFRVYLLCKFTGVPE